MYIEKLAQTGCKLYQLKTCMQLEAGLVCTCLSGNRSSGILEHEKSNRTS